MTNGKPIQLLIIGLLVLALTSMVAARTSSDNMNNALGKNAGSFASENELWTYVQAQVQAQPNCRFWDKGTIADVVKTATLPILRQTYSIKFYTIEKCFPKIAAGIGASAQATVTPTATPAKPADEFTPDSIKRDNIRDTRSGVVQRAPMGTFPEGVTDETLQQMRDEVIKNPLKAQRCKLINPWDLAEFARGHVDALSSSRGSLNSLYNYCYPALVKSVLAAKTSGGQTEVMVPTTAGPNAPEVSKPLVAPAPAATPNPAVCKKFTVRMRELTCRGKSGPKEILANCCA